MPTKGWHFVRTYFCGWHFVCPDFLVGILSGPSQHVLTFCPNHENPVLYIYSKQTPMSRIKLSYSWAFRNAYSDRIDIYCKWNKLCTFDIEMEKYILILTNKWFFGMWGVQTCKRRSSHSTQDYHSIKFRLLLVTLGCGGSVTAFRLLCCVVICLLRLALFVNVFPHSLQSNVVSVSNSSAAAHFHRRSFALTPESPSYLIFVTSATSMLV